MSEAETTARPRAGVVDVTACHADPVQWEKPRLPAAQTFADDTAAAALSGPSLGDVDVAHDVPFQCSMRLWFVRPAPALRPTAQTLFAVSGAKPRISETGAD